MAWTAAQGRAPNFDKWLEEHPEDLKLYAGENVAWHPKYGILVCAETINELLTKLQKIFDDEKFSDEERKSVSIHYIPPAP